jgi:7,8-dihydro-6-hydroxymethylpterin dimethyltransferase
MNLGLCNSCKQLVDAERQERAGRIYLIKKCAKCGTTETLISSDARRYDGKRALDLPCDRRQCELDCLNCLHKKPNLVFLDITNRCNMNCPICINNTPSMGFLFEPPLSYFAKIFEHFGKYDPRPAIQLFGGEPTVRKDLFDIIALARSHGLPVRVVTNGVRLADEEYCRKLVETRATICFAYDGDNPEAYRKLRGSLKSLEMKQKAMDNLQKAGRAKIVLMTLMAKGFNDTELPGLLRYCHERRDCIRGINFMPLAHTWDDNTFDLQVDRITSEDIEKIVNDVFPEDRIDFLPAGLMGQLPTLIKALRIKPLPFAGAHPNCESIYLFLSDGKQYLPLSRYLRGSTHDLAQGLLNIETWLSARAGKTAEGVPKPPGAILRVRAVLAVLRLVRREVQLGRLLKGRGPDKLWHGMMVPLKLLLGRRSKHILERHTNVQAALQVIVLPFEDKSTLETERLERCPTSFAFVDPADGEVKCVPVCAWPLHKSEMMHHISEYYARLQPEAAK